MGFISRETAERALKDYPKTRTLRPHSESALQDVFPFAELEQEEGKCRVGKVQTKGPRTVEVCHEGSQATGKSRKVLSV